MTDDVGHELVLTTNMDAALVDGTHHSLDLALGHAVSQEDDESRFEDVGLAITQGGLCLRQHPEVADSAECSANGGCGIGVDRCHY